MPVESNIEVSENLVVDLSKPTQNQTFVIALASKSSFKVSVKRIYISLDCVKVLNFNKDNAIIPVNGTISFIFEVDSTAVIDNDCFKIRFTFMHGLNIVRSIQIINRDSDILNIVKTDFKPIKENVIEKVIEIDDKLAIVFDQTQKNRMCKVFIRNNHKKKTFQLKSIHIEKPIVKLCTPIDEPLLIPPKGEIEIHFEATFVPNLIFDNTKIHFEIDRLIIFRSMKITYIPKGPAIQKSEYNLPDVLVALIAMDTKQTHSKVIDALNELVPSIDADYATHFHHLFYVEEIGLRKQIKDIYTQKEAYFCDTQTTMQDEQIIRKKYERGIYDLEVKDLYEVRPSLQVGDEIYARKHSAQTVQYKGKLVQIKDLDLICVRFGDDFVETFDHTAYAVEFDFPRTPWIRLHFALDLAVDIFGLDYLMPKTIIKRNTTLIDVHLNGREELEMADGTIVNWFIDGLNLNQKETVVNILRADLRNSYLIYGPPGTGKTTTLVEIVLHILTNVKNSNILITTQSNSAANLIVQRLIKFDQINSDNLLRLLAFSYALKYGHVPDEIKQFTSTVDYLISIHKTLAQALASVKRFRIVVGTSTTIAQLLEVQSLRNHFTHAIVDEAGQSTELGILVPMALVRENGQTIMAGDPMQMPPLVINCHARTRGLNNAMLSRLLDCYADMEHSGANENEKMYISRLVSKLFINYRSLPSILEYYNTQFYKSSLIPILDSRTNQSAQLLMRLSQIFGHSSDFGIFFVNVDGHNQKIKNSYRNLSEIRVIKFLTDEILKMGVNESDLGIITPYCMQARAIQCVLKETQNLKVGTVDDFQGLERKVVLISTVRTCPKKANRDIIRFFGFINCPKRINVAISRAQAMVIVVGKEDLLVNDEHWKVLIEKCKVNKTYRHVDF